MAKNNYIQNKIDNYYIQNKIDNYFDENKYWEYIELYISKDLLDKYFDEPSDTILLVFRDLIFLYEKCLEKLECKGYCHCNNCNKPNNYNCKETKKHINNLHKLMLWSLYLLNDDCFSNTIYQIVK